MKAAGRFAVLALALLAPSLQAQVIGPPGALPPAKVEAVEAAISSTMSELGIPGLSLALATGGEIRMSGVYGLADVENNVPAKAATVYRLASLSKPITAVAVLQLLEAGRLDLDAPIQKSCPAFPDKPWPLTARRLLGHQGGVRWYRDGEAAITRHYASLTEGLELFKDDPLAFEPGTRTLYSTFGYNLLGCAVEGASGQSFPDYLREHVFGPAGMERTRTDDVRALIPNRAQGYLREANGELANSALADMSYKVPGGGLVGTASDIAHFAMALGGGSLLKKESLAQMLSRQKTRDGRMTGYGLGLTLGEHNRRREAWHTGGQERVSNVLYWQPDSGLVIVMLSNLEKVQPQLVDLARRLADMLLLDPGAPGVLAQPRHVDTPP